MLFVRLLLHRKKELSLLIILSFLNGVGQAALVVIISRALIQQDEAISGYFVGGFFVLMASVLLAEWLTNRKIIFMGTETVYNLQLNLVDQILRAPLHWLETTGFARIIAALGPDVGTVSLGFNQLPKLIIGLPVVIGCTLYLAWLSPFAFAVMMVLVAPLLLGLTKLIQAARKHVSVSYYRRDAQFASFEELVVGNKELRLNAQRAAAFLDEQLIPRTGAVRETQIVYRSFYAVNNIFSQGVYFLFILAVFVLIALGQATIEILAAYVVVALYMKSVVLSIISSLPFWSQADLSLRKIESLGFAIDDLLTMKRPERYPTPDVIPLETPFQLHLQQATHRYKRESDDAPFTLGPIDLTFSSGELVFIVGHNGSGKTTLLKLLLGLYLPENGRLSLNGQPIEEATLSSYQNLFSAVFADFHLFPQLFGLSSEEQIAQARYYLERLQLNHKVKIEEGALSTINLSAGQRKRLALLIAYVEDRPIVVFDEWAESQDPEFTRIFYREILPDLRQQGKLVIVISHDDQYFDVADRLIELKDGQVKGQKV